MKSAVGYAVAAAVLILLLAGGMSALQNPWALTHLRAAKAYLLQEDHTIDAYKRLVAQRDKHETACPQQDSRTAVLLILGQSNAANNTNQGYRSKHGENIVNYFSGRCYVAASPLLGAAGTDGEYWTHLGNLLVDARAFDRVVLVSAAIGGSAIAQWAPGGNLHQVLEDVVRDLQRAYRPTHVLWHQGEIDFQSGTTEAEYRAAFGRIVSSLRALGVGAPIYVSTATDCWWTFPYPTDNPVARAQAALPNEAQGIRAGVNTDLLLGEQDRYDDCHFSASGGEKAARAWVELLAEPRVLSAPMP